MVHITPVTFTNTNTNIIKQNIGKFQQPQNAEPEFEKSHSPKPKRKYNDPLLQWPVRGLAFTNDIGAAVMDIAPVMGQALWVPALMYFGADIYDKYRNNKAEYDPSAKRGLKQAIFQALASVIFPITVVHAGQKGASILNRFSKEGVSLQTKEEVIRHHLHHMSQVKLKNCQDKVDTYKDIYTKALDNMIEDNKRKHKYKNPVEALFHFVFGHRHPELIGENATENIHKLIDKRIDTMFEMRKELIEGKKPDGMSDKMFKKFNSLKEAFKNDPKYADDYLNHAAKDILKRIEEKAVFKTKLAKTIGGFISLGLLIKPMDSFVENVIMHKYVGPGLDKLSVHDTSKFKNKFLNG